MRAIFSFCLFCLLATKAPAQLVNPNQYASPGRNVAGATLGLDLGTLLSLHYGRSFQIGGQPVLASAEMGFAAGKNAFDDGKAAVGLGTSIGAGRRWQAPLQIGASTVFSRNKLFRGNTLEVSLGLRPGYYRNKWFAAADLQYHRFLLSYLNHSDYYREAYYEGAQDGWYRQSGGRVQAGFCGGVTLGRHDLGLRAGLSLVHDFSPGLLPAYAALGYNFWF